MKLNYALKEPTDYFKGIGKTKLPSPTDILIFSRSVKEKLQQEALQNRSHHRFVLAFNLQTRGHVNLNHLSLPFSPGQALLIHPYQFHHFSQLASAKLLWLFCTFELHNDQSLEPLRNRILEVSRRSIKARNALLEEWHLCSDITPDSELQDTQLQVALARLLICLKQDRQASAEDLPPEASDSFLRTINRLMTEWRGKTMVVADLAKALSLSESRLRAVFRETAGIPLGSYIQNYRLNRAMSLLRTTTLPVGDVAEESGFGSPQAFSRIFRKETGLTPRNYRLKGETLHN
ncbi:MAG: helix-turn-helix transcriptional regulator [Verrucomicrobia bacterium]|nr:helix-turn-helix transcriptional regulator [Verrucomicrobiota bacterium]